MSQVFDCPRCGSNQRAIAVPSDGFGYFLSDRAVEAAEFDLLIPTGSLHDWLEGRRRTSGVTEEIKAPPVVCCQGCGFIAAIEHATAKRKAADVTSTATPGPQPSPSEAADLYRYWVHLSKETLRQKGLDGRLVASSAALNTAAAAWYTARAAFIPGSPAWQQLRELICLIDSEAEQTEASARAMITPNESPEFEYAAGCQDSRNDCPRVPWRSVWYNRGYDHVQTKLRLEKVLSGMDVADEGK